MKWVKGYFQDTALTTPACTGTHAHIHMCRTLSYMYKYVVEAHCHITTIETIGASE